MNFNNYFILLNYIITNYDKIDKPLILNDKKLKTEIFMPSDEYIMWHIKNIGTDLSNNIMINGEIPIKNILKKPKKYYMNILINNDIDFLRYAFYDIFFDDIKIAILVTDYIKNYDKILINIKQQLENYKVHYYFCIYDEISEENQKEIDINKIKNLFDYKNIIIKKVSDKKNIFDDINMNELFYTTSNIYDCYNNIEQNYFIYINLQANFRIDKINRIIDLYFDDIINGRIILHNNKILKRDENDEIYYDINLSNKFVICNLFIGDVFFKFHLEIYKYYENPDKALFFYLKSKEIDYISEEIYKEEKYKRYDPITINKKILIKKY